MQVTYPQAHGLTVRLCRLLRWGFALLFVLTILFICRPLPHLTVAAIQGTGYALSFGNATGSNDFVEVVGSFPLHNQPRTLAFWAKSFDGILQGNAEHIVSYGISTDNHAFGAKLYTQNNWWFYAHNEINDIDTGVPSDNMWHFHSISYDGQIVRYYLDGNLANFAFRNLDTLQGGLLFGIRADKTQNNTFNGLIDEVRIWNKTLTASEIQTDMHTILTGNELGLVGYWNFNEGGGQITHDASPNHYDGRLGSSLNTDSNDPSWVLSDLPILPTPIPPTSTMPTPITPTPTVQKKTWTFMLYLAGDTAAIDNGLVHQALARAIQQLEQGANPQVRVVALLDGSGTVDTFRITFTPYAQYQPLGEKRMDDPATLVEFVQQAQHDFPADQYYLAIADHANGVQGIAWDTTSASNRTALLTPSEIRQALVTITNNGARPIDVLHFDGCSFSLLEDAWSVQGLARYLVASENIGWGVFAYADYRAAVGNSTNPQTLARAIAQRYAQRVSEQQYPYTISALDLSRLTSVNTALNTLATGLTSFASTNQSNRTLLSNIRAQSQKFDSGGTPFLEITNDDTFVDLVDFAARVKQQIDSNGVPAAADNLIAAVRGAQPLVLYSAHRSGSLDYFGQTHIWNLDGAYGVSIYYPPRSAGATFGNYISGVTFPTFAAASLWPGYLQAGVPPLGPGEPLPNDGPDPLGPLPFGHTVYLPMIQH